MNDLLDFESLKLTVASPEQVRSWSFGEVTKPETINYRTLKAEKDGLFSENIFGPTKDYECYCGKYKRIRFRGVICDKCGVEVTQSKVRRERMGHINLASPVAHSWFVKGAPSKLSLILDISPKNLEAVVYFASYLIISIDPEQKTKALETLEKELQKKLEEFKDNLGKIVKGLEEDLKESLTKLKKDLDKEKFDLESQEIELKTRYEIQKLRDNLVVEQMQLENINKAISELVKGVIPLRLLSEEEYSKLLEYGVADFITVGMGAEALLQVLQNLNLDKLAAVLREEVRKSTGQKHIKATKRLRVVEGMRQAGIQPSWLILRILPVLPPDLRPMVQLPGGRFATSDLNDLYRRVINRNNRLNRLINLGAPEIILRNEKRMLQEAVDSLIDTSSRSTRRGGGPVVAHALRSLSDMLRGKQGRFRQNLLGKRVDYSGRSVIVVGPKLKLDQVGLPREMALEMFKPFVLREMIARGLSANVKGAKNVLETKPAEVWDILEEIITGHPILINRAPTLHRLGIQAFYPVLVDGNAIQVHPCVCAGFNADFDGDQMAIHVPLSQKAQTEAKELMMAKENIFGPANAQPIIVPNREMALGCYYLTMVKNNLEGEIRFFTSQDEAVLFYNLGKINVQQKIKVRVDKEIIETSVGRILFNRALPGEIGFINQAIKGFTIRDIILHAMEIMDRDRVSDLIDSIKGVGFLGATLAGISISIFDAKVVPDKQKYLDEAEREIEKIESNLTKGLITSQEKSQLSQMVWIKTTETLANATWEHMGEDNPIRMMVEAGARGSRDQAKQLSAMRGLSTDPTGKIVELPTKSNYRQGLSVFEYFTSARGARKGVADKALKTADAGYLTRRLVDVAHDVIIRSIDCGKREGLVFDIRKSTFTGAREQLLGRKLLDNVIDPQNRKILAKADETIVEEMIRLFLKSAVTLVKVRSPLTCEAKYGICQTCYGVDLTTRKPVDIGTPVGVVAAQAIGEPGTQLTMRTFHTGGIVGLDITQGLPRVEELFEARTPKIVAPMSEIAGKVSVIEGDLGVRVRVRTTQKPHDEREYIIPVTSQLLVEEGQLIEAGMVLSSGHGDVKEILRVQGLRKAQAYIVDEVRQVYESQGVPINSKHFEVIVRKMSDKVRIESQGDTNLLPGEIVDKLRFEDENLRVLASGGEPSTAEVIMLGITRASLQTESFLSAASFQETTNILSDAAIQGKVDKLIGLKENVIIGRLIPTSFERASIEG
ncbi:DNA-directed RNA polymerase subunit beta' [Candidatus Daviesbacteria bacterium RIFCSPLOWO2_01_FULL_38_10]|uniref:DNA-directed RNA polymerase subunit beta' n=1 Tax=Candidatus Daviesbacteria bacterium GW2011_GWF2_38_6 TaxID=1618432 RepID=A0A0G0NNS6_9BACT|nr:MAG: DNA-directed RNA polymerase subunit beta' [Candidatus Daviesbacteria bacterium GW2011_GWA2_38_17]KKQ78731.1 MAG: DNA-directed RNA polymerase subunit beta' [Candidatus Daviesbacteria bacterium GW2011_GWF2_38_6]OGE25863.1 MAG: DNA-directed RNA polymerase subunit beta' [Candidatus Daviesbacteria bacterium RIFCSPHIGHO2_02_FULL_39_41]OGE39356.1 MAG: DNA-directed RNA polymerase subunit beta' [Candidatus Daviesbacteria bacterium RIFCSPLOWO2_01_FULL_38_10]OGE44639.1 MAG: DNA-directed RNA polyme